jgi:phosphoserine phosphatase RsbU/P
LEGIARFACFELWGGNGAVDHPIELPGLQGWIWCTPFGDAPHGGDVHYVSVCSKGQVSRVALADVAGHGAYASSTAHRLRKLFQRHTDNWDQSSLMRELNEAFRRDSDEVRLATAVVLGFYIGTGELLFTNAGHLPLLWHHASTGVWEWLEDRTPYAKAIADLPLGLISGTNYVQTAVELNPRDTLILYTDGITESRDEDGEMLGLEGLLDIVRGLPLTPTEAPEEFGHSLVTRLKSFGGGHAQHDDETLVILQRVAELQTSDGNGTNLHLSSSNITT